MAVFYICLILHLEIGLPSLIVIQSFLLFGVTGNYFFSLLLLDYTFHTIIEYTYIAYHQSPHLLNLDTVTFLRAAKVPGPFAGLLFI